jgi:hypothetical protein
MKCECGLTLKALAPGVAYCDNEHMHIFAQELCKAAGYAPTEDNIRMLSEVAQEMFNAKIRE